MPVALLKDRGVVRVAGSDAAKLLQGLLTNDIDELATHKALFAGLLSPQGKILFDFLITTAPDGALLLDCPRAEAAALARKLTFYKLRAAAEITDLSASHHVLAAWDVAAAPAGVVTYPDPRSPDLGTRTICDTPAPADINPIADYDAHRIGLGVPEGGRDYVYADTFPHEALYDRIGGVSFTKGCYVGQEIVSRMQHRGTARKRILVVTADANLPASGTAVTAGDAVLGTMGSSAGTAGLALLRVDRVAEFQAKNVPITADGIRLAITIPDWARPGADAP